MTRALKAVGGWIATLALFAVSIAIALSLWGRYERRPWTRDGHVRADVVRVSSDVSGLVTQVLVRDNQDVSVGQPLLVLDRPRFAAALQEADAAVQTAEANLNMARREAARDVALGDLVATETHERNLAQVDTAAAALARAQAERRVALLNLQRTEVHATVNGRVTNLDLHPGDFLPAGGQAMALVDADTMRVEAYLEETKIQCFKAGAPARVRLMGERHDLIGHVESVAAGIADDQRSNAGNLLPVVQPTFSWVRLAQRIPVRVHLDEDASRALLISGRTATVTILGDSREGCR